jgi:integrase/recombinase XerD
MIKSLGSIIRRINPGKCKALFVNYQHRKLIKEGIAYIIAKYVASARQASTVVPPKVKAHMFRHSKAMHLLQAGINLIYIRDFLGHVVDLKTTEIYAKVDTETKRKAIEKLYPDLIDSHS